MLELIKKLLSALLGGKIDSKVIDLVKSQILGQEGGLKAIIESLQAKGLGDVVQSWVAQGKNQPVTPDQIEHGLGIEKLQELAAKSGLSVDVLKSQLAKLLPKVIDQLTPHGKLPDAS